MLDLSYRELLALTGGSRVGSHVLSGELGDLVPSAHRGGDYVQGGHGLLALPHVRLPHLVLLAERLAGRVSVKKLSRIGWFLVTLAYGGVKLVQIVRDLGFSRGLLLQYQKRPLSPQVGGPGILGDQAVFEFLRKKFREVLFRMLSEAYLSVNLDKQVPLRAVLVLVL